MPFTTNQGAKIFWDQKGSGTPVLLVMGHRYSSRMWYGAIDALAEKHHVLWFDNRGTGQTSTTGGVTVEKMARDAFAVMDAAGVQSAHIYGVSMGGVIVIEMARLMPDRVRSLIVGCSGVLSADKPRAPGWILPLYFLPTWLLERLTKRKSATDDGYGSAAPAEARERDRKVLANDPFTRLGVVRQSLAMSDYSIEKSTVAAMQMPALVLHGDEDRLVPLAYGEECAAILPHARFVQLQGAGHNYFVARGVEANAETMTFLDEVDGKS